MGAVDAEGSRMVPVQEADTALLVARSSIERGRGPSPGLHAAPFYWADILHAPPPRRHLRGEGGYVVFHSVETDSDTRITYTTVVSVDPGSDLDDPNDDIVIMESRVGVQHRLFLELIHRERAYMEHWSFRMRQRLVEGLVRQRRFATSLPKPWMRRSALWSIRTQGRMGLWSIRATRRCSKAGIELPDVVYMRGMRVWGHVYDRLGRRSLWDGIKDPKSLTTEQKSVVLTLSVALLLGSIAILNNLIQFLFPSVSESYGDVLNAFLIGVSTAVLLPFPPSELLVIPPYLSSGPVFAFLALVASKVVGAWLVFFIGDTLHTMIEEQTEDRPRMARLVAWMNRNSQRFGAYILAVFMTIPFLPDTLALYVFAVSGTSFRGYMMGALVGSVLRYGGVIALLMLFGEARVQDIFG